MIPQIEVKFNTFRDLFQSGCQVGAGLSLRGGLLATIVVKRFGSSCVIFTDEGDDLV
jgi:hypothetical protein